MNITAAAKSIAASPPFPAQKSRMGAMKRALLACALACFAAQAQAQAPVVEKITVTSLGLVNSDIAGGAATYNWDEPGTRNGAELDGYSMHVRVKPDPLTVWSMGSVCFNDWPPHINVSFAGTTVASRDVLRLEDFEQGRNFRLRGLRGGTTYQVRIIGTDTECEQMFWSDVSEVTVPVAPVLMTPSRSGGTLSLAWAAVNGATGYRVRWARIAQDWININGIAGEAVTGTSYTIPDLSAGQNYNVSVSAVTASGPPGAWSVTVDQSGNTLSADSTLSGLVITDESGVDLNAVFRPVFAPSDGDSLDYFIDFTNIQNVKVRPTSTHASPKSITLSMVYNNTSDVQTIAPTMVARGALSPAIPLRAGIDAFAIVTIKVIAEDGQSESVYKFNIGLHSNDATLSDLVVADFDTATVLGALTPAFVSGDAAKLSYRIELPNAQTSVLILATPRAGTSNTAVNFVVDGGQTTGLNFDPVWLYSLMLTAGTPHVVRVIVTVLGGSVVSYTLTIVRLGSGSADSTLGALALAHSGGAAALNKVGGDGSAGFAAAHPAYAATFESAISSIDITPTAGDFGATIMLGKRGATAAAVTSGSASTQTLDYGENTLDITVTAQNSAQRIYTLALTRTPQSTDATLRSLTLSAGTLDPGFSPGIASYTASVATGTGGITLTPTVNNALASVTVAGAAVTSSMASASQPLQHGSNQIVIQVTAEDRTTMDYTVTVTRIPPAASSNADLSALVLVDGVSDRTFAVSDLTYTATVANDVASVKIRPTVADTGKATVMVDGAAVGSGQESAPIALEVNQAKAINVVVTAEDRSTKTYTVTVTRALSGDNALSALTLSAGALDPTFDSAILTYNAMVAHAVAGITFTPTPAHTAARVTVANGDPGTAQSLVIGENRIAIVVTAQNTNTKTYAVFVTRAKSPDATLSALVITPPPPNTLTLAPPFSPGETTYTATVANAVAQITITPTSNHADARVTIDNTAVARGAGFNKTLSVGVNTIVIRVTAPDERTTRDYTLAITRAIPVASNDASLSALSISPGSLAENFLATTLSYTAMLVNSTDSIRVRPTVNQSNARVTVAGNSVDSGEESKAIALPAGAETVIEVVVTAQNADKRTYTLRITREAGKPGLPKNLAVAAGNAKLQVTWEAPDDENGAPVSGYKIRWRIPSGADFDAPVEVSGTAYTILRLAAGNYKVQILAFNAKGDGQYSDSQDGRVHTYSADVDDSGEVNAPDGIMLARYLLGVRGAKLVEAQSGDGNAGKVEENVQHGIALDVLDIDGDGNTDGKDGILLARYFVGLRGEALIANLGLEQDALAGVLAKLRGLTP